MTLRVGALSDPPTPDHPITLGCTAMDRTADATGGCGAWGPTSPPCRNAKGDHMLAVSIQPTIRRGMTYVHTVQSWDGLRPSVLASMLAMWPCSPYIILRYINSSGRGPVGTRLPSESQVMRFRRRQVCYSVRK